MYIAMGRPDTVEKKEMPEGKVELWTYNRFYPHVDAVHGFQHANFSAESAYQPQQAASQTAAGSNPSAIGAHTQPLGTDIGGGQSIGKTGGPQGGSMEPADLTSYTIKVLFADGIVVRIGADRNPN